MPDQYGNPTFKDIFENPEVFKQLYGVYAPSTAFSIGGAPDQPSMFKPQPVQRVAEPAPLDNWDRLRSVLLSSIGAMADQTRIFQGAPVEGQGARYAATYDVQRNENEQARQRAQMFNAQQENQFGKMAQQQAFTEEQNMAKQNAIAARQSTKLDEQTREAQLSREAANTRSAAERAARAEEGRLDRESRERIAKMQQQNAENKATGPKPPTEGAVKEATTIASLADSLDSAESAFNANVKAHPSRLGQTMSGAGSEFLPKLLGHNVGQSAASSMYPEAQFAEGQLNALSAVIDKLRTGNSRFAIQLYNALRPLVPTVGLSPDNAAKKFQMLRKNLDSVLRTRLKLAPNQAIALEDIQRAVEEDMGRVPSVAGQRTPSPPPPRPGERKPTKDVLDELFK